MTQAETNAPWVSAAALQAKVAAITAALQGVSGAAGSAPAAAEDITKLQMAIAPFVFGQDTRLFPANEAQYEQFWAQDAAYLARLVDR